MIIDTKLIFKGPHFLYITNSCRNSLKCVQRTYLHILNFREIPATVDFICVLYTHVLKRQTQGRTVVSRELPTCT